SPHACGRSNPDSAAHRSTEPGPAHPRSSPARRKPLPALLVVDRKGRFQGLEQKARRWLSMRQSPPLVPLGRRPVREKPTEPQPGARKSPQSPPPLLHEWPSPRLSTLRFVRQRHRPLIVSSEFVSVT